MSLAQKIDTLWRQIATVIAFSCFGIGGALLGLLFPILNHLTPTAQRQTRARQIIHRIFSYFMRWMRFLGILHWQIEGQERLGRAGQLIIANHPSLLDVVFIMAQIDAPNCVVKGSLWRNPCMAGPVTAAGFIPNDSNEHMIQASVAALAQGDCLIVFPEGTRSTPGQSLQLHRGAATIAIKGAAVLTPVVITISPSTLTKQEKWYKIPPRRFVMTLRVLDDIDPSAYRRTSSDPMAARRLNRDLIDLYTQELNRG
ncbi:1-acyl-sn-glycerol-3-phosphate acyltransferase [uncultured Deefgea sp.]|uniref:lysophospholipid acyltransferase family protein n=1 Tax=uncultured Deefgea sp. TaxID=1304914 RepID=UPI0025932EFB|nr:lysophospholipid acyltransferase family protein [uncultured Deefgea sp.]